jgi:tRNA threonylcarbamoyladenosine modification (KEOPS) complex Cgi121 subunit
MSFPRRVAIFRVKVPSGARVLGLASGFFTVDNVDDFVGRMALVDEEFGTVTQAFNAFRVAGLEHLVHASRLAIIANESGRGFADSLAIELICWVAAERQIYRAFEKMGVRCGRNALVIVSVGRSASQVKKAIMKIFRDNGGNWDNSLMELKEEKVRELQRIFSITPEEIAVAPLEKLVLERVSLLALAK